MTARRAPDEPEDLQGPPPREVTVLRSDRERAVEQRRAKHTASSPALSGGDVDADWARADHVGEEAEILEGQDRDRWEQEREGDEG